MEALYTKLYNNYTKLKKKKWGELDELNRDQELKFLDYMSASEELIHHLKSENERLTAQVNNLRDEMASISSAKDDKCAEFQKLLIEENQKNKVLSEEVERLHKLHQVSSLDGKSANVQLNTPGDALVVSGKVSNSLSTRMTRKRIKQSLTESEAVLIMPGCSLQDDAIARVSAKDLSKGSLSSEAVVYTELVCKGSCTYWPECCKSFVDRSGGGANGMACANCVFQALIEYAIGLKFSTINQTEGIGISALHQSSGFSFCLTWVNKTVGEESELLYRVLSLGTFERVAPEWMREALMFSTSMCPIFFERLSRVIKLRH
ncbi:hypothetical protein CFOL_v3_07341 [Cephalotus follicularis]|uniref:DUF7806 domain-containing protein n=1 Tax=Cephalotus follicularis TaxID=3775 RepID=A0A1Q3B7T9_CEPFO|nr:hypothetical protein CFOL_v3_07341 [Cephalotus follicularis]